MALKANRIFLLFLKLTVSSGLLYIVLSRTGLKQVFSIIKGMNLYAFISAILLYIFAQFISTVRWKLLLPGVLGIRKLFSLYLIGSFFNTILPGLVGGDAVKAFYLYQATGRGSLTLASIFMDRYLGFVMLIAICAIAFPFGYSYFQDSPIAWTPPLIVTAFIIVSLLIFGLRLGKRIKILSEFYDYFHSYRNQKGIIVRALVISALIQLSGIFAVYVLAFGLGEPISFLACLIFLPLIVMFTMIPISISGVGLREGAFVLFFGLIGVRPDIATALSLSWFLAITAGSLLGLIEYIRYRKEK
ncbi:MAG: lysylphosphatidylglycerol synthase transmembrane domain-containing protein [Thermodesulfovibrionales bacterium]|nr:lysylphosphatidylglycerol synthase transmembrane domain-containing protein [Thermodesulfovibrionales bacterium]